MPLCLSTFIIVLSDPLPLSLEGFHPLCLLHRTLGVHNIPLLFVLVTHLPRILDSCAPINHWEGKREERKEEGREERKEERGGGEGGRRWEEGGRKEVGRKEEGGWRG